MRPGRLHILTDTVIQDRFSHFELARLAFEAGVPTIQYRNKSYDPTSDREELMAIAHLAQTMGKQLIVNDDARLAFEVGAQGVHLGKDDGEPLAARQLLGDDAIIGLTVHNSEELESVRNLPVDYLGIGPVFGTSTKETGLPDLGLDRFRQLCERSPFPVIGIGSISTTTGEAVLSTGAYGLAVISAFCKAPQPQSVAKEFLDILSRFE